MAICTIQAVDVATFLAPRPCDSHKGTYGYIALIGGSLAYSGAAKLANWAAAAMVSGAGVIKLAVPRRIADAVLPYLLESTLFPLADNGDNFVFDKEQIDKLIDGTRTVAVGMGLGNTSDTQALVDYLLQHYKGNLLLDADGLNALCALDKQRLQQARCRVFLTPHLGEFARLCQWAEVPFATSDTWERHAKVVRDFAARYGVQLLLKGPTTLVGDGTTLYAVQRGCAGMATAGSGDVLSGIAAAVISNSAAIDATSAQNPYCLALACAAYINGVAGELAQRDETPLSMVASDTVKHIRAAVKNILENKG